MAKAVNCLKVQRYKGTKVQKVQGRKNSTSLRLGRKETGGPLNFYEPCNRCSACREITEGSFLDLIEIDAASNRGIDDIRNLREKIKLAPARARYKVYIIDEAHMLTTEAFNALLKTLEEPPAHALFILCTTAPEKLPATIISRCMRFNFRKAKPSEVMVALKPVVRGEKLKVEKGVLEEIGKAVDGSFRDAKKVLEQLSFAGKKITLEKTKELLGKIEALAPAKLLSLLATRDVKSSLQEVDRVVEMGGDLTVYVQEVLDRLRLGMLVKVGLTEVIQPEETEDYSLEDLRALIRLFSQAVNEMRTNPIMQLPLELVVVEWCGNKIKNETRLPDGQELKMKNLSRENSLENGKVSQSLSGSPRHNKSLEEVMARWDELLAGVRPLNHSVEALLRAARPAKMNDGILILEVFYPFHKERLETEKCRSVVEGVASQILGAPVKIRCILGQKKVAANPLVNDLVPSTSSSEDIVKTAEEIFETE